ncbi:MAG: hypothetical protein EBV03_10395, partial [Proteobacteria bacterium]|nr:hypothetical protein [Pseudomonadota bacterium]
MAIVQRVCLIISYLWLMAGGAIAAPDLKAVTAGDYKLDPSHTSIIFNVSHLGFSSFASRFDKVEGSLTFDPDHPEASKLDISIDAASVNTNCDKLDNELRNADNFNVANTYTTVQVNAL